MASWLVNRNDTQFAVSGMAELQQLAKAGQLDPGDMIQPPGATDWLYAVEIPQLEGLLPEHNDLDDDDLGRRGGGAVTALLAALLLGIAGAGGYTAWHYSQRLPDTSVRLLDRLSYSEMVVTGADAPLLAEPESGAHQVATATAGSVYELLAKRGDFYRARHKVQGSEGWIGVDRVMPVYQLGGGEVMKEYDPLYNPDRYLLVQNASWMQLPEQRQEQITVFQFMLRNQSAYDMTDLVMVARIKDGKGHDLEQVEFRVEGLVPAQTSTMVGSFLDPETKARRLITQSSFDQLAALQPDLALEYNDGVEVRMQNEDFTEASIDIVELRAIPSRREG